MDRKKFFSEVREFQRTQHKGLSQLEVDAELASFVYTPHGGEPINVSFNLMNAPDEVEVFIGDEEELYEKEYFPAIVNKTLQSLFFTHTSAVLSLFLMLG